MMTMQQYDVKNDNDDTSDEKDGQGVEEGKRNKRKKEENTQQSNIARGRRMTEAATATVRGEMMTMRTTMRMTVRGSTGDRQKKGPSSCLSSNRCE